MVTARLGQMVTLGPCLLTEQPLRLSHNTESQAQGPKSQSQGASAERRRWRPERRRVAVEAPPSGGQVSQMAVDRRLVAAEAQCEIQSNLLKL